MELIVLGACGTWPGRDGATSGYLVRHGGFSLMLDAGSGTLARLQRYEEIRDLGAVLVSHGHPDHMADLYPLFYARHYGGQGPPGLPLFAPDGFMGRLDALMSEDAQAAMRRAFEVRELSGGERFEVGPFSIETRLMAHIGDPALGFRIEAEGAALAYSGDTGPCDELVDLARDADLLLAEATWQDGVEDGPFHLSARQAGEHAAEAGARRLLLTHIWPTRDRERSRREAAEGFSGTVEVATEDMRVEVGA